jgi:hypothetical protein
MKYLIISFIVQLSFSQTLIINESMSKNNSAVYDEDNDTPDWIEIYNNSASPINMGDYYLTDDRNDLQKWKFPDGIINADSHLVVFTSDKDRALWPGGDWIPVINFGSNWHYITGYEQNPTDWNSIEFDPTNWSSGPTPIGFGDDDDMTIIDPVFSIFMRKVFEVDDMDNVIYGLLHMDYDDGFVVYINGVEVLRENLGEPNTEVPYDQFADTNVEANIYRGMKPEKFFIENIKDFLIEGQNVLAFQVHNASENLNDLTALPILSFYVGESLTPSETSEIKIKINADSYPEETSWELVGIDGTNFNESIAPGTITLSNVYEWSFDVPTGDYLFKIMDTWGDGICCEDGVPVDVYNSDWESDGGWSVWPTDVSTNNWEHSQGNGHENSYRSIELSGTSSTGNVAIWQQVDVYPGELHQMSVYAKQTSENALQAGQTAYAHIEFWAWGWSGPYMIEQHTTDIITHNSPDDTWIKLDVTAEAPAEAGWTHLVVVFNNQNGNSNGAIHFDDISYRNNVHNENSSFYTSGSYSLTVNGSRIVQGGSFTDVNTDTFDTENLFSDLLDYQDPYLHTNFKITASGETVFLTNGNENIVDTMFVPEMEQDLSYGYNNDGGGALSLFSDPSPGETNENVEAFYGYTADPEFSSAGGFKDQSFNLFITSETENATIYYTTDGSKPDETSNIYNDFIAVNNYLLMNGTQTQDEYGWEFSPTYNGIIIRALAIAPDHVPSKIITNSYIYDPVNSTLPVVSIAIDPDDMFDPISGIHVTGNEFLAWYPYYGSNFWEDWEKEVHIELFEPGGHLGFKQAAGMKIFGGWSRAEAQKSFSFFARSIYGEGSFDYQLFPDSDVDSYESFILRAHGQDNVMFRDGFITTLASENGVPVQDYRPAVVYLNGEFWGIQNIREKVNEHYIETHYNIENDNLDLLSTVASTEEPELIHGSTEDYLEIRQFISNNDLSIESNYEIAAEHYDVERLIDYKIAQIFVMNYDWPGNNNKLFKAKSSEGKWQHIMFDSDFGFERWTDLALDFIGSYQTYNMLDHAYGGGNVFNNPVWSTVIFTSFLDNSGFRTQFINTYCDRINSTYSSENTTYLIDSLKAVVAPYVSNHISRYGPSPYDSYTPNTMADYNSAVQRMYNFSLYRPDNAMNEMVEIFDLQGSTNTISLYMNDSEGGYIQVNSLEVHDETWSGDYFSDVPISIKAVPKFGYQFSHWEASPSLSDSVNLLLNQDMIMIANFSQIQNPFQDLVVINEINYHSSDDFDSGDWVELYNNSNQNIDLSQWKFMDSDDSHIFTISDGVVIESGGYLILCRDSSDFSQIYPDVENYIGEIDFGLSNGGELLRLIDNDEGLVDFVTYDDSAPWPLEPDGEGRTLELLNPSLDNNNVENWVFSGIELGTPGQQNSSYDALSNDVNEIIPSVFTIHQNYPNPFNPRTSIDFGLPEEGHVSLKIYDIMGREVVTLANKVFTPGYKSVVWNATNSMGHPVSAGMYFYTIQIKDFIQIKKMILMK